MLLDLDFNLKNIDGTDAVETIMVDDKPVGVPINLGKAFARLIYNSPAEDELRMISIATKLFNDRKVEVDKVDLSKLEEFLNNQKTLSVAVKAPIKEAFEKAKAVIQ